MATGSAGGVVATRVLETVSGGLWNLKARLMADIVEQHGPAQSLKWFASNMPTYEKILKTWGPLRTHYLAVTVSAINGCGYCTYGHAYAFVLHYFERTGKLFPLSEHELRDLGTLDDNGVLQALIGALRDAGMGDETPWVERIAAAHQASQPGAPSRPGPGSRDDQWLQHLVEMFGWLNACGIAAETEPDAAHDPINKNSELRRRYDEAQNGNG